MTDSEPDTRELAAAIAEKDRCQGVMDALTAKQVALEERLGKSRSARDATKTELSEARKTSLLGDGPQVDTTAIRIRLAELDEEVEAAQEALSELNRRIEAAAGPVTTSREAARFAARQVASQLAESALERPRALVVALAVSLQHWHDLYAVAQGAFTTGVNQQRAHGLAELLARYGVRLHDGTIAVGHPEGRGALLSPEQVLTFATEEVAKVKAA